MMIAGDISGIQTFITNVKETGGGQAKRLRARSFYVQLLCEAAAVRILAALGWPIDRRHLLMSAAGHFLLRGPAPAQADALLKDIERQLHRWLLTRLNLEVRLNLGWSPGDGAPMEEFHAATQSLFAQQMRPLAPLLEAADGWDEATFQLAPLDTPCSICSQQRATIPEVEIDQETGERTEIRICEFCHRLKEFGGVMTDNRRQWLILRENPAGTLFDHEIDAFGLAAQLSERMPNPRAVLACTNLRAPETGEEGPFAGKWLRRPLARSLPRGTDGEVLDFKALASESLGDRKLGVLKADGDRMGEFWDALFARMTDPSEYGTMSERFDAFSAAEINSLFDAAAKSEDPVRRSWRFVYTLFSGGDDFLLLGPWSVMVEFAGALRQKFGEWFGELGLTLSAGLAIVHPNWPVRRMASMAEEQLELAKTIPADGAERSRDQFAGLGGIWKWNDHATVLQEGRHWIDWVNAELLDRGMLRMMLEMIAAREGRRNRGQDLSNEMLAPARLDYLLERRVPANKPKLAKGRERDRVIDPDWASLQRRLRALRDAFESPEQPIDRLLAPSLQYAWLATRTRSDHDES